MAEDTEPFLKRWSRRKLEQPVEEVGAGEKRDAPAEASVAPVLPPVENLSTDSDFSGFMHPKVEDGLRRVALKKLFSDPHFNTADPFEPFSGDWTVGEQIPEAMLASLEQVKQLRRQPEVPAEVQAEPREAHDEARPQKPQEMAKEEGPQPDEPGRQDT